MRTAFVVVVFLACSSIRHVKEWRVPRPCCTLPDWAIVFTSRRFCQTVRSALFQPRTTFGSGGDIKPLSLTVAKDHCVVLKEDVEAPQPAPGGQEGDASHASPATYILECGDGETYINGG